MDGNARDAQGGELERLLSRYARSLEAIPLEGELELRAAVAAALSASARSARAPRRPIDRILARPLAAALAGGGLAVVCSAIWAPGLCRAAAAALFG